MNKFLSFNKEKSIWLWIIGFQVFRLVLLPFMGLMPQDAYYFMYGQHLSLSYFDHPGMIGYLLRLSSELFGTSVFVIKLTDFMITSLTLFVFYRLALLVLSKRKSLIAILLLASTLFISVLSFNSTPDVPLLLFWTLSILSLYQAIFEQKKVYWLIVGLCMGLAFTSKYTALLLQIGLILFLIFSTQYRKLLVSPWLWLCIIISFVIATPIWIWNYQNDWASFTFQSSNRVNKISEFTIKPELFFGTITHQILLLLPIVFVSFCLIIYKHIAQFIKKLKLPSSKTLFLLAFFIPTFLGFFLLSPFYWVKINWMMPSYITGVILITIFIKHKWIKYQIVSSIVIHLLVAIQVVFYVVPIKSNDTWVGWKELAKEIELRQKLYPDAFIFSDDNYKTAAVLNFYLNEMVYAGNIIGKPALHFDYLGDHLNSLNGKNAILIDSDKRIKNDKKKGTTPPHVKQYFKKVTEAQPIIIKRYGKTVRKFWVYYCQEYEYQ